MGEAGGRHFGERSGGRKRNYTNAASGIGTLREWQHRHPLADSQFATMQ